MTTMIADDDQGEHPLAEFLRISIAGATLRLRGRAQPAVPRLPRFPQELIEQLSSDYGDGFTHAQAVYGVNKAYR